MRGLSNDPEWTTQTPDKASGDTPPPGILFLGGRGGGAGGVFRGKCLRSLFDRFSFAKNLGFLSNLFFEKSQANREVTTGGNPSWKWDNCNSQRATFQANSEDKVISLCDNINIGWKRIIQLRNSFPFFLGFDIEILTRNRSSNRRSDWLRASLLAHWRPQAPKLRKARKDR